MLEFGYIEQGQLLFFVEYILVVMIFKNTEIEQFNFLS